MKQRTILTSALLILIGITAINVSLSAQKLKVPQRGFISSEPAET